MFHLIKLYEFGLASNIESLQIKLPELAVLKRYPQRGYNFR